MSDGKGARVSAVTGKGGDGVADEVRGGWVVNLTRMVGWEGRRMGERIVFQGGWD